MNFNGIMKVTREDADFFQKELGKYNENITLDRFLKDDVLRCFSFRYPNGSNACIRIRTNGSSCWADPVIFDRDWNQIGLLMAKNRLLGEHFFAVGEDNYSLLVESEENL